jgi:hypothetical protein
MHNFLFDGEFPLYYIIFFYLFIFLGNRARGVTIEDKEQADLDILTWVSKLLTKIKDAIEDAMCSKILMELVYKEALAQVWQRWWHKKMACLLLLPPTLIP